MSTLDRSGPDTRDTPTYLVDFGYTPEDLDYIAQLPTTPPPAASYATGDRCGCASCASEGWYNTSPLCRFWHDGCELCKGSRSAWAEPCSFCGEAWTEEVAWFRYAVGHRDIAAQVLRDKDAAHRDHVHPAVILLADVADIADDAVTLLERAVTTENLARQLQRRLDDDDEIALLLAGGPEPLAARIRDLRATAAAYRYRAFQQLHGPTATPSQT